MPSRNRVQLKSYIRYQLSQLSARNAFHDFENLAFELARVRIVSNILPATGPVQAGGDQGRDFETYKTYLAKLPVGTSAFATPIGNEVVVGACSLQKDIVTKINSDLTTIFGSGVRPNQVVYFCEQDVPVAVRHKLQRACHDKYQAGLEIFDGQAIADLLADRETFWIAEQFLSIPADEWPEEAVDEIYDALRGKWIGADAKPNNYADFLDIKLGLRTATFEDKAKPDLGSWLELMTQVSAAAASDRLVQKARYEIAVAELRGRGSLDPAFSVASEFFSKISDESDSAELLDAAVLGVYAWGALNHRQTSVDEETVRGWISRAEAIVGSVLARNERRADRCMLLDARAIVGWLPMPSDIDSVVVQDRFFDLWSDVVEEIKKTPYYAVRHVADILEQMTPILGAHPRFRLLADQVDQLIAERVGSGAAADRARNRAVAHLEVKRYVAAIDELQRAKIGWFSGETIDGSILSMLVISDALADLNLYFAARYYASGALFLALQHHDERLKRRLAQASFALANTFFGAGEGLSFVYSLASALTAHHAVASDPHDWTKHPTVQSSFAQAVVFRAITRRVAPSLVPLVDEAIASWPLPEEEKEAFVSLSEEPPWSNSSDKEIEAKLTEELGQYPFHDIGPRSATWSALGITWTINSASDRDCWLAALEVATVLQLAQVEFADVDLVIIPSQAAIEIELRDIDVPRITQLPDNGKLAWRISMPSKYSTDDNQDPAMQLAAVAITILGQATALPFSQFQSLVDQKLERGLPQRFFSVRPIRELMDFAQPEKFDFAKVSMLPGPASKSPIMPLEADELKWRTGPGPGYSKAKAEEYLHNRYEKSSQAIRLTLPRIVQDARCNALIRSMKSEGLLDWPILGIIASIVVQYQVEKMCPARNVAEFGKKMTDRMYRPECDDDPQFDLAELSQERVEIQKKVSLVAMLRTWKLTTHRQTPDLNAIKRLLDARYNQATDDIPHAEPFKA